MNLINLLKTLQEAELRILISILFQSIITAGKEEFAKVCFCLGERDLTILNTFRKIEGVIFWN